MKFRENTIDEIIWREVVNKNCYNLPWALQSDDIIIDIGCHIGAFGYACKKAGAGKYIGFDVDAENVNLARQNLADFNDVNIYHLAVWDADNLALGFSGYPTANNGLINTGAGIVVPPTTNKPAVKTISLDTILTPFPKVSILKLDCEGSEIPILKTCQTIWKASFVCGELHTEINKSDPSVLYDILSPHFKRVDVIERSKEYGLYMFFAIESKHATF
jgi:FkbM family methyltransferase